MAQGLLNDWGIPIPGYRFAAVIMTGGLPQLLDIRFQKITGLKISRELNTEAGAAGLLKPEKHFRDLVLTRGVMALNNANDPFVVLPGSAMSPLNVVHLIESLVWDKRLLRCEIMVAILSDLNIPIASWLIRDAYLTDWSWGDLDGTSNSVLIESMTYKYSDLIPIGL